MNEVKHRKKVIHSRLRSRYRDLRPGGPYDPPLDITSPTEWWAEWDDSRIGESLPDWQFRVRAGVNATTPYVGIRSFFEGSPHNSHCEFTVPDSHFVAYDSSGIPYLPGPVDAAPSEDQAYNQALSQFISKARSSQTKFLSGVFAGELGKTLHQLRHPAQALRSGLSDYLGFLKKRRHNISPRHKRKFLSETWLEYSYGWIPLVHDINDAGRAINNSPALHRSITPIFATGSSEGYQDMGEDSYGFPGVRYRRELRGRTRVKFYGAINSSSESTVEFQQKNFGLDLSSFVPTLWELIPYSFLVDYFLNVGDVLSALSFRWSDLAWAGYSIKKETFFLTKGGRFGLNPSDWQKVSCSPGRAQWKTESIHRSPVTGPLIPRLQFQHPDFGSLKWLNLAALARTHASLVPF